MTRPIGKRRLAKILKDHAEWWMDSTKGKRADLCGADLRGADLQGADLREADLREADLQGANLQGADLREANLREADLHKADLRRADLQGADLRRADLQGADLREADLREAYLQGADLREADLREAYLQGANLQGADLHEANLQGADLREAYLQGADLCEVKLLKAKLPNFQICPEEGDFIGWKKVSGNVVLKLLIIGNRTSSLVGRKCRCDKAKVLEAYGNVTEGQTEFTSNHDSSFKYRIGEIVECPDYDGDIRVECTKGIHFFLTRKEAEEY